MNETHESMVMYLNKCLKEDPAVINTLFNHRIQITNRSDSNPIICNSEFETGILGILNGCLQSARLRKINMVWSEEDFEIIEFN